MMIAAATPERRCNCGRTLGHCCWNTAGRGAVCAAYIELACCVVICGRAGFTRCTDGKKVTLNAVPIWRHEIWTAASTQHNVARHPRPPYTTQQKPLGVDDKETCIFLRVKFVRRLKSPYSAIYRLI